MLWKSRRWLLCMAVSAVIVWIAEARSAAGQLSNARLLAAYALPTLWSTILFLILFWPDWRAGRFNEPQPAPPPPPPKKSLKEILIDEHPLRKRWKRRREDDLWEVPRPGWKEPGYSWLVQWLPRPLQGIAHFFLLLSMLVALVMVPGWLGWLAARMPEGTQSAVSMSLGLTILGLPVAFVVIVVVLNVEACWKAWKARA